MSAVLNGGTASPEQRKIWTECVGRGVDYLISQQNSDGGFGDTDRSHSNIATSYLALAASALADQAIGRSLSPEATARLENYLHDAGEIDGLRRRYGKDKTFVVPILTNMAIAGLVPWKAVSALPFEAAVFPQSLYRWLQMPVVSYAIPALVAIGQARHFHGPKALWPLRMIRKASIDRTMRVLLRMQPESGGYLEATPLTSFVIMSLAATGRSDHEVCRNGLQFLVDSMDNDGSWPIDTNLATWVTSLSIHALARDPDDDGSWCGESLVDWHLSCQHRVRHPFTGAEPGGWGWTDLSGAVPDSDDTPAAIIACRHFQTHTDQQRKERCADAIDHGIQWLQRLQNRDGGWPTFCRGWGKLPFDRSSNDLTAHVIRALMGDCTSTPQTSAANVSRGTRFIERNQQADGSWLPLWFGNQDRDDETNPVYGTSRVLVAGTTETLSPEVVERGCQYLLQAQNPDGGWGGGPSVRNWMESVGQAGGHESSSVEETALAVDALVAVLVFRRNLLASCGVQTGYDGSETTKNRRESPLERSGAVNDRCGEAIIRGVEFLIHSVHQGRHRISWPIGFYFAKLWYHEELYPLIFDTTALGNYLRATEDPKISDWLNDR
jgi:squalene-hopene/tetraprenyl-beta-curcumene cyclase